MSYQYMGRRGEGGPNYTIRKGQYTAGVAIGIIHIVVWYPLLPGNVVNANTYPFPVRYQLLEGGTQDKIHSGDSSVLEALIDAGRKLQGEGVRAICGACGYLGNFQAQLADALEVPVYLSSLLQIPMIRAGLRTGQRIGILCADGPAFTPRLLAACGVPADTLLAVAGLQDCPEFSKITYSRGEFDAVRVESEVVAAARKLVEEYPDIGAILLECSDMPPFAWAVQQAIGLPVFDFTTMIRWVHSAVTQRPYEGIC